MNGATPDVLLFDLGGVIIDVATLPEVNEALGTTLIDEVGRASPALEIWEAFELGALSPEEFALRFVRAFPLAMTPAQFLTLFASWNRRVLPGAAELLQALRQGHRLAALSNTNALHWARLSGEWHIERHFERVFTSHELGLRKPDPQIYRHVIQQLGVLPSQVLFFDDNETNIASAMSAGLRARRVEGLDELRAALKLEGVSTPAPP